MIAVDIPGYGKLQLDYLVMDYNGTLACDGNLLPGVAQLLNRLSGRIELHVITADTFGRARGRLHEIPCRLAILPPGDQAQEKLDYVTALGPERCVCVGNGRNDRKMLAKAALGIAVVLAEGAAAATLAAADIVCTDILDALELLDQPLRLTATLRG